MIFLAFASAYIFVLLKSFQQLNVSSGKYLWILPTSLLMAVCEVYVTWQAASRGWGWICLPIGFGAGLGAMTGMWLHARLSRER